MSDVELKVATAARYVDLSVASEFRYDSSGA